MAEKSTATWDDVPTSVLDYMGASSAAADVIQHRLKQIWGNGYTQEHDDEHTDAELAQAAIAYAVSSYTEVDDHIDDAGGAYWPWDEGFKRKTPREDLVRAGALILAEIERIDRLNAMVTPEPASE